MGALAACSNLEVLKLYDYQQLGQGCLHALSQGCPRLRVLEIPGCHGIRAEGVVAGGPFWATSLEKLDASLNGWVSDACARAAAVCYRSLTHLYVLSPALEPTHEHTLVQTCYMSELSQTMMTAPTCPHVGAIDARRHARHVCGCKAISDEGLAHVAEHARRLVSLGISSCPRITDDGMRRAMPLMQLEVRIPAYRPGPRSLFICSAFVLCPALCVCALRCCKVEGWGGCGEAGARGRRHPHHRRGHARHLGLVASPPPP